MNVSLLRGITVCLTTDSCLTAKGNYRKSEVNYVSGLGDYFSLLRVIMY